MAFQNLPVPSSYKALILRQEAESDPSIPIGRRRRTHDDESLVRQPPKPAELNSLNTEPDPDLQLTPLKQKEQPKGLLRSQSGNSKVRHRVRFQDPGSFSCESESEHDLSTKVSEISITDNLSDCEFEQENQNNNNGNVEPDSFFDVSSPNPSNCMFFDVSSDDLVPQLLSVEVVREINQNQKPSPPPIITSDFPTEDDPKTDRINSANPQPYCKTDRINSANPQPYCKTDYESRIPSSDVSAENASPIDIDVENTFEERNVTAQKKKAPKSISNQPKHSKTVAPASASLLPVDATSADPLVPGLFGQPQLHSTLLIAQRIKTLQKKRPDLTSELKKNLDKEEQRNKINGKAASKVDIRSSQDLYTGLISLDVSNSHLEEAAAAMVQQRPAKVKQAKKKQTTSGLEPDLLEFFTEDLQKESADFSLPGIPPASIGTCKAPSLIAFDLYRHNRMWEGLPDTV